MRLSTPIFVQLDFKDCMLSLLCCRGRITQRSARKFQGPPRARDQVATAKKFFLTPLSGAGPDPECSTRGLGWSVTLAQPDD